MIPAYTIQQRWQYVCEACGPGVFPMNFNTFALAEKFATEHQDQHAQQPYCICATRPVFVVNDDDEWDEESGHKHCRDNVCCSCGCLSREVAP